LYQRDRISVALRGIWQKPRASVVCMRTSLRRTGRMTMTRQSFLIGAALIACAGPASAVTADVARQCNAAVTQAFPPRAPGNPAAGRANGDPQAVRAYFNRCVANNGKTDDKADDKAGNKPGDNAPSAARRK
jgi:hypothetical protein